MWALAPAPASARDGGGRCGKRTWCGAKSEAPDDGEVEDVQRVGLVVALDGSGPAGDVDVRPAEGGVFVPGADRIVVVDVVLDAGRKAQLLVERQRRRAV